MPRGWHEGFIWKWPTEKSAGLLGCGVFFAEDNAIMAVFYQGAESRLTCRPAIDYDKRHRREEICKPNVLSFSSIRIEPDFP